MEPIEIVRDHRVASVVGHLGLLLQWAAEEAPIERVEVVHHELPDKALEVRVTGDGGDRTGWFRLHGAGTSSDFTGYFDQPADA